MESSLKGDAQNGGVSEQTGPETAQEPIWRQDFSGTTTYKNGGILSFCSDQTGGDDGQTKDAFGEFNLFRVL